jgi:electron transfer flavoprotein alpha subunit
MSDVLAVSEHRRGDLRDVSLELITAGRELTDAAGGDLHTAVLGGPVEEFAERLRLEDVDAVHTVDYGEEFNHDIYVQAVEQLVDAVDPSYVLIPNSVNGQDYAPALSERLGWPLVTDAVALDVDGGLTVTREFYGGKVEGVVEVTGNDAVVTVRPTEWPAAEGKADVPVKPFDAAIDEEAVRSTVTGFEEVGDGDVDITEADVLVSVGRGIGEEDNLDIIFDLAEALDATVSASGPVVANGWLSKARQVGQSGKTVVPDVYIAVGISGAVHHVAGIKDADTIVAINNDPSAPIFDIANYGIVDDLFDVVPALTEAFRDG